MKRGRDWHFLYLAAAAFVSSCATAIWQEYTDKPIPYRVLSFEHRITEGRVYIDAVIQKLECERLPAENDGFFVAVERTADEYRAEWRDEDQRNRDENRAPGIAALSISIPAPTTFRTIEVWTTHACPTLGDENVRFVERRVGIIQGDVSR